MRLLQQKYWHRLFETGVLLKAISSVWETTGSILILFAAHRWAPHIVGWLERASAARDRDDILYKIVADQLSQLTVVNTRIFVGSYLLFHGILNVFLVYNLFRNRLWAYPVTIGFSLMFLIYQVYRFTHTHSPILLAATLFDAVFIYLTWHEYRYQKRRALAAENTEHHV